MSKLGLELQKLGPSAIIELYELDLTPDDVGSTNKYYFHSGKNDLSENIVWQGQEYTAMPIKVEGFETTISGQLPRLRVSVANVSAVFTALILSFDDMLGAKLTRKRTFKRYLDAVNFEGGVNADADPTVYLPDDIFYAQRKVTENKNVVEMEFATKFDMEGVMVPRRQVTANLCAWRFRGEGCRYSGNWKTDMAGDLIGITPVGGAPYAEWNDATEYDPGDGVWYGYENNVYVCKLLSAPGVLPTNTTYWTRTGCIKTLEACKLHFGATSALPFGAFPGVARIPQ